MNIVSLLPSATEMICLLGLRDQLVGVTHECDFPPGVGGLPKVTRTQIPALAKSGEIDRLVREQLQTQRSLYAIEIETLAALEPDLIVTQGLCDVCAVSEQDVHDAVATLPKRPEVINLHPQTLQQVFTSLAQIAEAMGEDRKAKTAVDDLRARVEAVATRSRTTTDRPRVVMLEWLDPPFSSGHWGPEMVRLAGGLEQLGEEGQPSRGLNWSEVVQARPEVVVIACCGFDVDRTMEDLPLLGQVPGWQDLPAVAAGQVFIMDGGQYFSRPGPRLVDGLEILAHALHPAIHPLPRGLPRSVKAPQF